MTKEELAALRAEARKKEEQEALDRELRRQARKSHNGGIEVVKPSVASAGNEDGVLQCPVSSCLEELKNQTALRILQDTVCVNYTRPCPVMPLANNNAQNETALGCTALAAGTVFYPVAGTLILAALAIAAIYMYMNSKVTAAQAEARRAQEEAQNAAAAVNNGNNNNNNNNNNNVVGGGADADQSSVTRRGTNFKPSDGGGIKRG